MRLRELFWLVVLISLIEVADVSSQHKSWRRGENQAGPQRETTDKSSTVELDLRYDFSIPGETGRLRLLVILPKTIPDRQKILGIKYSPKPTKLFYENGNRYAEFVFAKPKKQLKVEIKIKARLFPYDLFTAKRRREKRLSKGTGLEEFLKEETYIEKDHPEIQQIARSIKGQTQTEIVKNIYNYVSENMEYAVQGQRDLGAVKAAQEKKGDCSEYADLFVAICRAKKIPARVATGYTIRFDNVSPKHHWVEVYLRKYGWVPFDPSWGDVENIAFRNRVFDRMKTVYIYLTHIRNDDVLYNNHFYTYAFWGDKVELKDSIEFKQSAEPQAKSR